MSDVAWYGIVGLRIGSAQGYHAVLVVGATKKSWRVVAAHEPFPLTRGRTCGDVPVLVPKTAVRRVGLGTLAETNAELGRLVWR